MSNPNRQHFSIEPDDEKSISDSAPIEPKPQMTPDNLRFLFENQKSEEAAFRQYEDDEEDTETVGPGRRRKKAARSLKGLFKARNLAAKAEKKAATEQLQPLENVIPINSRRQAAVEPPLETSQNVRGSDEGTLRIVEQERGADVQETFRVDPDAAASPDHQAAEEAFRGTSEAGPAVEPIAAAGAGGGGYDGPPSPPPNPPTPSRPRVEDYLPPAAVHNPIKVLPASVERRGGIAGPLTAFFAADYLSRRRNRRARKETNKLKTEIKDTQRQQQVESRRLRSIEDSIRNNSPASPAVASSIESKKPAVAPPLPATPQNSPVKVSEILATTAANREALVQESPAREKTVYVESETPKPPVVPVPPVPEISKMPKEVEKQPLQSKSLPQQELSQLNHTQLEQGKVIEELQKQQIQKVESAEQPRVKRDKVAEEVRELTKEETRKAGPTLPPKFGGTSPAPAPSAMSSPRVGTPSTSTGRQLDNASSISTAHRPMLTDDRQKELYRKSMRAGIVTGLLVAGLGVLAYLVLL